MTLSQVLELFDYWRKFPPVHEVLKAVHGVEAQKTVEEQVADGAMGAADVIAMLDANGGKIVRNVNG